MDKLYRVEVVCADCGEMLLGSDEKPHLTRKELRKNWGGMVMSAPLNTPRCPKCGSATDRDYNAHTNFLIDDGKVKMPSKDFFASSENDQDTKRPEGENG